MSSKNPYELLGTSDQDSDREPSSPTKEVEKPLPTPSEPAQKAGGFGRGSGRVFTGSEGASRGRDAGTFNNRGKVTDDGLRQDRHPDRIGVGRRGGRGDRGRGKPGDRHSRGLPNDHPKQGDLAWGAPTGEAELKDEVAGEAIANLEVKEASWDASDAAGASGWHEGAVQGAPGFTDSSAAPPADGGLSSGAAGVDPVEPEDTSMSYAEYHAKQEEEKKKMEEVLGVKKAREPNEGADDVKWQNGKPISRDDEHYIMGPVERNSERKPKSHRPKGKKVDQKVELDLSSWKRSAPEPRGGRGGRGEFRGRGRGGGRGGDGEYRGRGGDGEYRGGGGDREYRGRGDDGEYRGRGGDGGYRGRGGGREGARGRGGNDDPPPVAVDDESAFPSLGA